MYKRDLIAIEIQRLAEVLSKILGLKLEGDIQEADTLFNETIEHSFGLNVEKIKTIDLQSFESMIDEKQLTAEKLDMLSQFLYSTLNDLDHEHFKIDLSKKILHLFEKLEKEHRIMSLDNLRRQEILFRNCDASSKTAPRTDPIS